MLAGLLSTLPSLARAGNDDSILLGNDAALTAGAVVATVNDGSALWYNPAGLATVNDDSVDVGATALALRTYRIRGLIATDSGASADANFTEFLSIPSAVTWARRIDERSAFGVGLFASRINDFTLRTAIDFPVRAGGVDVDASALSVRSGEDARYHAALGYAIALPRGFAIGASLVGDYRSVGLSSIETFSLGVQGTTIASGNQALLIEQTMYGFHARIGVTYAPTSRVRLGLSLETPSAYFRRVTRVTGADTTSVLQTQEENPLGAELSSESDDVTDSKWGFGMVMPLRVRFGGAVRVGDGTISLEGDVASKLDENELEERRRVNWNVRAGARFPVSESLSLGAGFFTDRGPERRDESGAGVVDFYGGTVGFEWQKGRWLASETADAPRDRLTFSTTGALRYAYGSGKFAGSRLDAPDYEAKAHAAEIHVHEVTVHIGSGLYF